VKLDEEFDREQDIEELRRLARARHAQSQQLMEALTPRAARSSGCPVSPAIGSSTGATGGHDGAARGVTDDPSTYL
jgi:hypothetical protein